jgi:DNA-binding NarL/FixJ family response regulator
MEDHPSVLIVAPPGKLRESLRLLLASSSHVKSIRLADNHLSATWSNLSDGPDAAILALDPFGEETLTILQKIQQNWPKTRTVILVDSEQEYKLVKSAGADVIFMKGIRAANLLKAIEELLSHEK